MTSYAIFFIETVNETDPYEPTQSYQAKRPGYKRVANEAALKDELLYLEKRHNVSNVEVYELGPQITWTKTVVLETKRVTQ